MRFTVNRDVLPKTVEEVEISTLDDLMRFQESQFQDRYEDGQWPAMLIVDFFPEKGGLPVIEIYDGYRE